MTEYQEKSLQKLINELNRYCSTSEMMTTERYNYKNGGVVVIGWNTLMDLLCIFIKDLENKYTGLEEKRAIQDIFDRIHKKELENNPTLKNRIVRQRKILGLVLKANLLLIFILTIVNFAFAAIPIYCPKCKTHLYNYQKDEINPKGIVSAKDFKPVRRYFWKIPEPKAGMAMVCPIDKSPLNGWEIWAKQQPNKVKFVFPAVSLLTKDKYEKLSLRQWLTQPHVWKWIPYPPPEDTKLGDEK